MESPRPSARSGKEGGWVAKCGKGALSEPGSERARSAPVLEKGRGDPRGSQDPGTGKGNPSWGSPRAQAEPVLTFRGAEGREVDLVHLLGVIFLIAPLALASGCPTARLLLEQVPGAVVDGNHVRGHLLGVRIVFGGAGELQLAEDLAPDGFDPLAHELVHVERAAGRQAERRGDQQQESAQHTVVHFF